MGLSRHQKIKGAIAEIEECEKYIAALEAELAKHEWHVIDPEDEGTWPEEGEVYTFSSKVPLPCGHRLTIKRAIRRKWMMELYTHYCLIVGPGGGE